MSKSDPTGLCAEDACVVETAAGTFELGEIAVGASVAGGLEVAKQWHHGTDPVHLAMAGNFSGARSSFAKIIVSTAAGGITGAYAGATVLKEAGTALRLYVVGQVGATATLTATAAKIAMGDPKPNPMGLMVSMAAGFADVPMSNVAGAASKYIANIYAAKRVASEFVQSAAEKAGGVAGSLAVDASEHAAEDRLEPGGGGRRLGSDEQSAQSKAAQAADQKPGAGALSNRGLLNEATVKSSKGNGGNDRKNINASDPPPF